MARGDHFFVWRRYGVIPFQHHAIDLGNGEAIHFSDGSNSNAGPSGDSGRFTIARVAIATLTRNGIYQVHRVEQPTGNAEIEDIVARAESQVGRRGYHLFHDNCEHFATWCVTGHAQSCQVSAVAERASSIVTKTTLMVAARVAAKSVNVLKPWGLAADVVQLGTEFVGHRFGLSNLRTRKRAGRALGGMTAMGLGAVGGPTGIAIAGSAWLLGELSGEITSRALENYQLRRGRPCTAIENCIDAH